MITDWKEVKHIVMVADQMRLQCEIEQWDNETYYKRVLEEYQFRMDHDLEF